jgi:hypothetical protein
MVRRASGCPLRHSARLPSGVALRMTTPAQGAACAGTRVRVHRSAIDAKAIGRLSPDEPRVVHERLVRYYGFDLGGVIREELKRLAAVQRRRQRG